MKALSRSPFFPVFLVSAALVNHTIDDEYGDSTTGALPVYQPGDGWAQGDKCGGCNIKPSPAGNVDVSRVHNGTWHDSTYHPGSPERTINVTFTGQAVYVFNLIANTIPSTSTVTNLTFYVDGTFTSSYAHTPDNGPAILYDVLVFHTDLPHGPHTLTISSGGSKDSLLLFDYIIYTVDDDVDSHGTQPPLSSGKLASTKSPGVRSPPSSGTKPRGPSASVGTSSATSATPGTPTSTVIMSAPLYASTTAVPRASEDHAAKSPAFAGGIVGGIIGGVVAILLILLGTFVLRRYARLLRWPRKPAPTSKDDHVLRSDHNNHAEPSFPADRGEPTAAPPSGSQHETSSLTSLLSPSASRSPSPLASEDYTAVAPYSDPKFARRLTDVSKDSHPSSAPPGTEAVSRASSSLFPAEFTFVRASAAPPSHAVDVPAPALSVTSTARSMRYAELSRQIEALESAIQCLHYPGKPGSNPNPDTQRVKRERLRALKGQIAELRVELSKEHRLAMEAAPKSRRKGKQPRQLAVVV